MPQFVRRGSASVWPDGGVSELQVAHCDSTAERAGTGTDAATRRALALCNADDIGGCADTSARKQKLFFEQTRSDHLERDWWWVLIAS